MPRIVIVGTDFKPIASVCLPVFVWQSNKIPTRKLSVFRYVMKDINKQVRIRIKKEGVKEGASMAVKFQFSGFVFFPTFFKTFILFRLNCLVEHCGTQNSFSYDIELQTLC